MNDNDFSLTPDDPPSTPETQAWLADFQVAAASTSQQIAAAAYALKQAVGEADFPVIAPLMLEMLINTSAESANNRAAWRAREVAMSPRPQERSWRPLYPISVDPSPYQP